MATHLSSPAELPSYVGKELGTSQWVLITQERINLFADATDDHQWIHVDVERAAKGPFGKTVAHGYLTLSLAARFMEEIMTVDRVAMAVNYGLGKVRFTAPVPVDSELRATGRLVAANEKNGAMFATIELTYEVKGADRPPCIAEVLVLLRPE